VGGAVIVPSAVSGAHEAPSRKREHAVLILTALGKAKAGELLQYFSRQEIDDVISYASSFREPDTTALNAAITDFGSSLAESLNFRGTADELRGLLTAERARDQKAVVTDEPIWTRLAKEKPERIRDYLMNQHPQAIAYILFNLPASLVADVLSDFLAAQRNDIVTRLLGIRVVIKEVEQIVQAAIQEEFFAANHTNAHFEIVAELLNQLNSENSQSIIAHLEVHKPADAAALRKLLFQFDDLPALPVKTLALVLDRVSTEQIAVALKGANASVKEALLSAMTPRARRMIEAELQSGAVTNERDVAAARKKVASTVVQLVSEGVIQPFQFAQG
jgi:flagellar motor switch protein FliG